MKLIDKIRHRGIRSTLLYFIHLCCGLVLYVLTLLFRLPYFLVSKVLSREKLLIYFDMDFCPLTFDAAWMFLSGEIKKRVTNSRRARVIFHLKFERQVEEFTLAVPDKDALIWRFNQIVLPLLQLFPAIDSYAIIFSKRELFLECLRSSSIFPYNPFFGKRITYSQMQINAQHDLSRFSTTWGIETSLQARRFVKQWIEANIGGKKLLTITIRRSHFNPKRNSNIPEWVKFTQSCDLSEYAVVYIMDTDTLMEGYPPELSGCLFFDAASWNLSMRAALYEEAYMNLMTPGGPFTLCILNNKCRCLIFKFIVPGEPSASKEVMDRQGLVINETPKWIQGHKKFVWEPDDAEVIQREFVLMCKRISGLYPQGRSLDLL